MNTDQPTPTPAPAVAPDLGEIPLAAATVASPELAVDELGAATTVPAQPAEADVAEELTQPSAAPVSVDEEAAQTAPESGSQPETSLTANDSTDGETTAQPAVGGPESAPTIDAVAPSASAAAPTIKAITSAPPQADAVSPGVGVSGKPIVLPNGKVGEPYSFKFTPDVVDLNGCLNVRVLGPDGIGLTFDQATQALAGQPAVAGQHDLRLSYVPASDKPGQPAHIRALQWYVNPDPRSLWTEHEPAADMPARKSHVAHFRSVEGSKTLVAASRRGRSHAKDAKFREDDFRCYYQAESKCYVLAVADGAGSAMMSREGSRLACETATQHILTAFAGETTAKLIRLADEYEASASSPEARKELHDELYALLGNAALLAVRHITQAAETAGQVVRDYATTLLLAVCCPTANGWLVGAFWIGDGGLGLYRRAEGIRLLGEPDGGEYSGQTRFLTMKETFEAASVYGRIRFELVPDFDALCLMTDGITDALFQTDSNLAKPEKWAELLDNINGAAPLQRDNEELGPQLSEWLNYWVKGEYDDRTLAILF